MSHAAHRPSQCRNCGHDLAALPEAHFCPHCGQETVLHPPTLWEFVHEFITHYVALEGALWRTLGALLLRPGKLTREYFHGRRKHYVLPLRVYLTASFVFFLVVKLLGGSHTTVHDFEEETLAAISSSQPADAASAASAASTASAASATSTASAASSAAVALQSASAASSADEEPRSARSQARRAAMATYLACAKAPGSCNWLDTNIGKFIIKSQTADAQHIDWQPRIVATAPYAIFLMLPLFAGLLQLIYWGRRMPYGEHFVFSLHLHSFWFIALLLLNLLPDALVAFPLLAIPVYGCWAMRNVYGGSWWSTLTRASVLSAVYGVLLGTGTAVLAVWVIMVS
ncbi:DUF3667 domain-containing protein [Ideonella sp.]|uniref:DUF3667 domain-containing protein n=1 Tax=Ideonella sp. TaxID=1929293 RepID=UPI003BB56E24